MKTNNKQQLIAARQKARHYAVQAIYQWHMNHGPWSVIASQFLSDYSMNQMSREYFKELLQSVVESHEALDALLEPHMDLKIDELGTVEHAILQLAAYELQSRIDIPYRSVINEAVNLAKKFAAEQSFKYVNAVLDKLASQLRTLETKGG